MLDLYAQITQLSKSGTNIMKRFTRIFLFICAMITTATSIASVVIETGNITLFVVKIIESYPGHFGSSPAISENGSIYINVSDEEDSFGRLIGRSPDGTEYLLLDETLPNVSPVLNENGTIYMIVPSEDGAQFTAELVALTPSGAELWRAGGIDGWAFNGPALGKDGSIIVTTFTGNLYAFSSEGVSLWDTNYNALAFSPTVVGPSGNIYIPTMNEDSNSLIAYSAEGQLLWQKEFPFRVFSGVVFGDDGTLFFGADGLYAMQENGDELWNVDLDEYDFTGITGPAVTDSLDNIYVSFMAGDSEDETLGYSGMASFSSEGILRWTHLIDSEEVFLTSPLITADGIVLFGSDQGNIYELSADSGEVLTLPYKTPNVSDIFGLTVDHDGNLLVNGSGGVDIIEHSLQLATSSWPKYMRDNRNSASAISENEKGNNSTQNTVFNDVDGDGKSDLLWRSYTKGWNFLWTMDGTQSLAATPINVVPEYNWDMVGLGDYNSDGRSDIFWRNQETGQNFIYLMDGAVYKSRYTLNYVGAEDWRLAGSGDFDGDGNGDVLWRNVNRGDTWFYLMEDGVIRDSLPSLWVNDLNYQIVATGDIDGDGDDDIIWRNSVSGINYVWLMQGGAIANRYTLNSVNTEWAIAGTGDLDGDGTDDIVLRNQVGGENWVYFMEHGQIRESKLINTVADTNWKIANIGDYDGDGKADFLWRHAPHSRNLVHLMDGVNVKGRGVLRPTDDTWRVAH